MSTEPSDIRLRVFTCDPSHFFAAGFERIRQERMQGLDLINPRLNVHASAFRRTGCHWIGTVVTPWSVVAVIACGDRKRWKSSAAGETLNVPLTGGDFTFLTVKDAVLGEYLLCALKSPVHDFADQAAADAFAETCLTMMTTKPASPQAPSSEAASLTRRMFLSRPVKEITSC